MFAIMLQVPSLSCCKWRRASSGFCEKKCGTRPEWSGNVLAARGYEPRRTETELSEEKYFF